MLTGLLKLSPEQRDNISDELRSHLEERMEDLLENGSSREEAIAAALEDFGDTAALAHHFTNIAHHTRRRRLMRYTYGTIAAMTCSILVLASFWPGAQPPIIQEVVAQLDASADPVFDNTSAQNDPLASDATNIPSEKALVESPFQGSKEKIEQKLSQPLTEFFLIDAPFMEVLDDLSDRLEVTFYIDPVAIEAYSLFGQNISDGLITLEFPDDAISAKTLLEYGIKSAGAGNLWGYTIRDNIVVITLKEETFETVIYQCRDLIFPQGGAEGMGAVADPFGAMETGADGLMSVQFGSGGRGGGLGGGGEGYGMDSGGMEMMGGGYPHSAHRAEGRLIEVLTSTIEPESWSMMNPKEGIGAITAINGLLVVKHTREVQDQVKDLLQKLREAMKE
ncbi:MAG: permease prefix domain 1-containing protein [Planctomycetaceae bacterium]|nr:permease prefix domain 1-containing protein [Planctomycetaceae bacterium]